MNYISVFFCFCFVFDSSTLQDKEGWPTIVSTKYLEPFVLTSFALSLLLVFRTNSAYGRWWEARKSFGIMYNCTRILSRLVC